MDNILILPEGMLVAVSGDERVLMSSMKGVGLNLDALSHETLYQLQDGIIAELRAWEDRLIQVLHEQRINMDQLKIQRNELVAQSSGLEQVVEDSCRSVPELAVLTKLLVAERVHILAAGVHEAWEEMTKVQLEMNLQIIKMQLKVQPSTTPEFKEQCTCTIQMGLEQIGQETLGCIGMLEQALTILMHM